MMFFAEGLTGKSKPVEKLKAKISFSSCTSIWVVLWIFSGVSERFYTAHRNCSSMLAGCFCFLMSVSGFGAI